VETANFKETDYRIRIPAWGFVEPRDTIDIRTEISGKVIHVPAGIYPGAAARKGILLFSIDARNHRNNLAEATAATKQARQALKIEKGRQVIARTEWEMLNNFKWWEHHNETLALRKPQLEEREAALVMATARQAQAALDVERTRITAPCDGLILKENLAKGRILNTDEVALQIACTECYQIMALFSPSYALDPAGRVVEIKVGPNRYKGTVKSVLPQINPETRQKQALVEFRCESISLGAYASLTLLGQSFKDVVVLPKEALRPGNTAWVLNESSTLEVRPVTVLAQDMLNVVIGKGLTGHDQVILSHIAGPLQGMELQQVTFVVEGSQHRVGNEELKK
jgi:RND family efflux transporter MFP subunit